MSHVLGVPVTMGEFLQACGGQAEAPHAYRIARITTDSRDPDTHGGIFFALRGKRDDGHRYVATMAERADYCVVSDPDAMPARWRSKRILVADTLDALNALARLCRNGVPGLRVIAVAGSNGKTTTKELIRALLATAHPTAATVGNLNNRVGAAFTLLALTCSVRCCVVEVGISEPGEMDALGRMVSPNIAVVTNIGHEHLEMLGDLDGVFREETALLGHVRPGGWAVLNADDHWLAHVRFARVRSFGMSADAAVTARDVLFRGDGMSFTLVVRTGARPGACRIRTRLSGAHQLQNILAAVAAASLCEVEDLEQIARVLEAFEPVPRRGQVFRRGTVTIVDECYNANPESMRAALRHLLDAYPDRPRFAVLGDMLELGAASAEEHRRLMAEFAAGSFRWIGTVGDGMRALETPPGVERIHADDIPALISALRAALVHVSGAVVLVKGSRGMQLERVVEALQTDEINRTRDA